MMLNIANKDCFEYLKEEVKDGSIDLILIDPPYGTIKGIKDTRENYSRNTGWDCVLPMDDFFNECNRVLRPNGILIVFGQEPFTSNLISKGHNNLNFMYRAIWKKNNTGNALNSKKALSNYFEDICLFTKRDYDYNLVNPLREYAKDIVKYTGKSGNNIKQEMSNSTLSHFFTKGFQFSLPKREVYELMTANYNLDKMPNYLGYDEMVTIDKATKSKKKAFNLPTGRKSLSNIFEVARPSGDEKVEHPTQKPIELLRQLIATFSDVGDSVLDFTMGSGSTAIAAIRENRDFFGCELDKEFFKIAQNRINKEIRK